MSYDPFRNPRDAMDIARTLDQFQNTQETAKTRQLLEEQNRLQREANELKKKELAQQAKQDSRSQSATPDKPDDLGIFSSTSNNAINALMERIRRMG